MITSSFFSKSSRLRALAWALPAALLAGCPTTYQGRAQVYVASAPFEVLAAPNQGGVYGVPGGQSLAPLDSATVTCEGCREGVRKEGPGSFLLDWGSSYSDPPPSVVTVSAPGYQPVKINVQKAISLSEVGPGALVIVLKPLAR